LAKSSISAFCRSLSCAQAAKRKKAASTIAARLRISVLVRLQGLAPATWQTWAYCSPAQAIKATAIMAAMKSKLSPRPINGTSATFVARVKLVLLSVSIRTSPDWFVPITVARHKGKSWLPKDKRRTHVWRFRGTAVTRMDTAKACPSPHRQHTSAQQRFVMVFSNGPRRHYALLTFVAGCLLTTRMMIIRQTSMIKTEQIRALR